MVNLKVSPLHMCVSKRHRYATQAKSQQIHC
jgi:hypothetical protein